MPLPDPIGRQKEVLYLEDRGHVVVLGTAGSGKTTLAILRAAYLSQHSPRAGRTMLVTFNRVLARYMQAIAPDDMGGVDVLNYHLFARGYLHHRGKLPDRSIVDDEPRVALVGAALADLRDQLPGSKVLQNDAAPLAEELLWISRMGIHNERAYREAERIQRGGLRVAGADRPVVWQLYEKYLALRARRGFLYDWHDIGTTVLQEFSGDTSERLYRHIVIDEGQDFSPVMLRSLAAAIPAGGSVTFFGDIAQQIYGSRLSWRDAGLAVGRNVWRFEENYRNTQEIAAFALDLANGPHFLGDPDMVEPKTPKAEGVPPTLVECSSERLEQSLVVEQAAALAKARRVAVLLRDRMRESYYAQELHAAGVVVRRLNKRMISWPSTPGVWIGTYHSAKGLEFDAVILPHVNDQNLPHQERVAALGDARLGMAEEARLLYVAITRAKAQLLMTYSGKLTPLLQSIDPRLYTQQGR